MNTFNNKLGVLIVASVAAFVAIAAPQKRGGRQAAAAAEDAEGATAKKERVVIDQFPKLGRSTRLAAPGVAGGSIIGACFTKPRQWIVCEAKYTTYVPWVDQLTFTWHVMLETKTATEKDKEDRSKLPPYSYFTTTVTYANIPKGSHAASVCLHPSYLERFGEPKAIGLVISNKDGEIIAGNSESEIKGIKKGSKFWEDSQIMDAKINGEPMVERRQGLLDRSKTIWSLVNPNDYEMVLQ